uniref:Uncharacterized protein n=1 Tax=Cacopsylla melanoneura TaxID=428564 RepID=A0A8D8QXZ1_9HEMI
MHNELEECPVPTSFALPLKKEEKNSAMCVDTKLPRTDTTIIYEKNTQKTRRHVMCGNKLRNKTGQKFVKKTRTIHGLLLFYELQHVLDFRVDLFIFFKNKTN